MSSQMTPPPTTFQQVSTDGKASVPWTDWFNRLVTQANTSAPEAVEAVMAMRSFAPPPSVQYPSFSAVESQAILAAQIFGS